VIPFVLCNWDMFFSLCSVSHEDERAMVLAHSRWATSRTSQLRQLACTWCRFFPLLGIYKPIRRCLGGFAAQRNCHLTWHTSKWHNNQRRVTDRSLIFIREQCNQQKQNMRTCAGLMRASTLFQRSSNWQSGWKSPIATDMEMFTRTRDALMICVSYWWYWQFLPWQECFLVPLKAVMFDLAQHRARHISTVCVAIMCLNGVVCCLCTVRCTVVWCCLSFNWQ